MYEAGGKPAVFNVSDICDGVVQATDGMSYSLISRDIMAAMVEIHALGHPHDGMVLISGNDKSVPAHLLAIARCDLPAIHLPGGTQLNAPDYMTSNKLWAMGAAVERGEVPREDLESAQRNACPTCGACQFMGSASTGTCRWMRSKSSIVTSTPASRAIGGMWSRAVVDPPMAACRTMAFSNASRVRMARGLRSCWISETSCLPVARA